MWSLHVKLNYIKIEYIYYLHTKPSSFIFLHVQSSDPEDKGAWKDKGRGNLSIKCKKGISKGTKESKPTIVVRNDVGLQRLYFGQMHFVMWYLVS